MIGNIGASGKKSVKFNFSMSIFRKISRILERAYGDIFLYPRDKIAIAAEDYDAYWKTKRGDSLGCLSEWQKARADIIIRQIKSDSTGAITIGDIACGDGSVLAYLSKELNISFSAGYDCSHLALQKAAVHGIKIRKIDFNREEDLRQIEPADFLLLLEAIEHSGNSEKILKIAFEKSNRGVFFSIPNSGYFKYRLRLLFGKFPAQWINLPNEHLRFWTARDLKWWLRAQDYSNFEIHYYKGVPLLNKIWPYMFAAAFLVFIKKI